MAKLADLPSELLTSILGYVLHEDPTLCESVYSSRSFQPCEILQCTGCSSQRSAFTNLCLVSRKIRSHAVDMFWQNLYCIGWKSLRMLHRILQTQPILGSKVYQLYLEQLTAPMQAKKKLRKKYLEQSRVTQDMLHDMLAATPKLRTLYLQNVFPSWTKEEWVLRLPCKHLRVLDVSGLTIYPDTIDQFSSLASLQSLTIQKAAITKSPWKSEGPVLKSKVSSLRFEITEWPQSRNRCNKVTCLVLSCFPHLRRLELYLSPSTRRDYGMSWVLKELPARSNISFLEIHYSQSRDYDSTMNVSIIDLSTWTNLVELRTDNITLWPIADDPESRELLYERLPRRLKVLNIDFLYWEHGSRTNYRPDGQRRLSKPDGHYIWDEDPFSKRFRWLLNLVLSDPCDGTLTVLPCLEKVYLQEKTCDDDSLIHVDPPSIVSSAFLRHGINLVIKMIGPTLLPC